MLGRRIAYGLKNFHSHMGISSNVTLRGLLRRTARRYPRTVEALRRGSMLCGMYFVMMSLIPGSSLPLQRPIKLSLLAFSRLTAYLWYYNLFAPEPEQYLIKLNEIILSGLDQQIYDPRFLAALFARVREVVEEEKKGLKQSAYLDLLLYAEIILQTIIRYEKRLLLEPQVYDYYEWLCGIVFERVATVSSKEEKHIRLVYSVVQYLLNFSPEGREPTVVTAYHRLAKKSGKDIDNSFGRRVVSSGLQQSQFSSSLKKLYSETSSEELRQKIIEIFETLNLFYQPQTPS